MSGDAKWSKLNPVQAFFDHLDHGGTIEQFLEWYDDVGRAQLEAAAEVRLMPSRP